MSYMSEKIEMLKEFAYKLKEKGYKIAVHDNNFKWLIVGNKTNDGVAYIQADDMEGFTTSTVHYPSKDNGTGSRVYAGYDLKEDIFNFTGRALFNKFKSKPPKIYKDIEEYIEKSYLKYDLI